MIRVNSQYLDLAPDTKRKIVIDKQSKLFEDLEATQRDFSYNFDLPTTTNNLQILGFPRPDTASKTIYNDIPCDIIGEDGITLYTGKLRVEKITAKRIQVSF